MKWKRKAAERMITRLQAGVLITSLALFSAFAGCAKPGSEKSLPAPQMPQVRTDTPEQAARSALLLMQNELRAVAARDAQITARIHEMTLGIVSRREAEKALKNVSGAKSLLGEDVVSGMIELWTAALAHYSEGIDFASFSQTQGPTANEVTVYANAAAGPETAYLRLDCSKEENRWVIRNFSIDPAGPPRGGPSQPTSGAAATIGSPASATAPAATDKP